MFKLKHILTAVLAVGVAAGLMAVDYTSGNPPYVSQYGSKMQANSAIFAGGPKDEACTHGLLATAAVDISEGDALVMVGTTYPLSVSKTATAGDPAFIGVALADASFSEEVQVCRAGKVKAHFAITSTYGLKMVTAASAGKLTASTAVAEALYTGLSGTAIAGRAAQVKTVTGGSGQVLMILP